MSETFPERLRRLRKRQRFNQTELAKAIGCRSGAPQVSMWERGHYRPQKRYHPRLAKALGVTETYLRTGTEALYAPYAHPGGTP